MATNQYFKLLYDTDSNSDQKLVEDLIIEMILIHGTDYVYLPRTLTNFDKFFGEDVAASTFKDAYTLEFYPEEYTDWQGQGTFTSQFGLENRDEAVLCCSIKRFAEEITSNDETLLRPREGDVLVFPQATDFSQRFFEIMFVSNEEVFYQLGKIYVYKIRVKAFEFSGEHITTGVDEIDEYQLESLVSLDIKLVNDINTPVIVGEKISQAGGWEGEVLSSTIGVEYETIIVGRNKGEFNEELPIITQAGEREVFRIDSYTSKPDTLFDNENVYEDDLLTQNESNPFLR